MLVKMETQAAAGETGMKHHTENINAINTPITSKEIINGVVVCSMGTSTTGNHGQITFYGTVKDGVVTPIQSSYGSSLPINGTYINLSYDTTTHKFTYSTKHATYYLGAMDTYTAPSIEEE